MAPFARYPNITGLIVDVTNEEQIRTAIATVKRNVRRACTRLSTMPVR